jgi:hypothetical protein
MGWNTITPRTREATAWGRGHASILIERPRQSVFAFVCEPQNDWRWLGDVRDTRQLTPGPVGVGSRFRQTAYFMGAAVEGEWKVVEFIFGRRIRIASVAGSFEFVREYSFAGEARATRFTKIVKIGLSGGLAFVPRLAADVALSNASRHALARLKSILEETQQIPRLHR